MKSRDLSFKLTISHAFVRARTMLNAGNVSERAAHPSGLFLKQERMVISLHREIEDLCSVQAENEDEIKNTQGAAAR